MEISNETRDRLIKDLSNDELEQELASRHNALAIGTLLRWKCNGEVVMITSETDGITIIQGESRNSAGKECWRHDFSDTYRWTPVTLTVKE